MEYFLQRRKQQQSWRWPPTNVHEVQVVMGMFNYYKKFIPNFSEIAQPIIELIKKDVPFIWTSKHQLAFDCLMKSPILYTLIQTKSISSLLMLPNTHGVQF